MEGDISTGTDTVAESTISSHEQNANNLEVVTPITESVKSDLQTVEIQSDHGKSENNNGTTEINCSNPEIIPHLANPILISTESKKSRNEDGNFLQRYFRKKSAGFTKRQITIIIIFAFVEFFAATVISIPAPFFPEVAIEKGATSTEFGLIFAVFELTVFIMSPIFGAKMNYFGPKRLFNWGILVTGFSCVVFGLLNLITERISFVIACFIVRIIKAVGDAAFVVASFTIIAMEFPDKVAPIFGTMETFYGVGMIAGPVVGACLYEAGGYILPFILMGGFLFASALASYFLLPEIGESESLEKGNNGEIVTTSGFEMFKMLRFSAIFMIAYSIVATTIGVGFLQSTLEPHLDDAHKDLNKVAVGFIFILNGGVYCITAPFWGALCEKSSQPKMFTVIGSICTILGFLLVGPVPFLPWETNLWSICIGLVLFGLGLGATLVSAFIQALQDAVALGYPDDVSTYGLVSGLWTSMTALGFFIGSGMGGILTDLVGVRYGTYFVLFGQLILVILMLVYFYKQRQIKSRVSSTKEKIDFDIMMKLPNLRETERNGIVMTQSQTMTAISNPTFEAD